MVRGGTFRTSGVTKHVGRVGHVMLNFDVT